MIYKNEKKTFAVKVENLLVDDGCGRMIRVLPCIDGSWFEEEEGGQGAALCIGLSWLFVSVEFWFGHVEDLI